MKPPNQRDDMTLSRTDLDFMRETARVFDHAHKILSSTQPIEKTLQDIHTEARLKRSLKELRSLIELLGETNRPEAAAYIQTAQDSVSDCLDEFFKG